MRWQPGDEEDLGDLTCTANLYFIIHFDEKTKLWRLYAKPDRNQMDSHFINGFFLLGAALETAESMNQDRAAQMKEEVAS